MSTTTTQRILNSLLGNAARTSPGRGIPDGQDMRRYLAGVFVAAVPCLAVGVYYLGQRLVVHALVAVAAVAAVEFVFAAVRRRPANGAALPYGLLLALCLPPSIPFWMTAAGSAFAVFFGKEVFGGTGYHIFAPVLVGKAFLVFSYPTVVTGAYFGSLALPERPYAWLVASGVTLCGGITLLAARRTDWRVLAGITAGAAGMLLWIGALTIAAGLDATQLMMQNGFLFAACFLAGDPACAPRSANGRLAYGLVIGAVAIVMRRFSNYEEAMMAAVLVGNVFAPTLDLLEDTAAGDRPA